MIHIPLGPCRLFAGSLSSIIDWAAAAGGGGAGKSAVSASSAACRENDRAGGGASAAIAVRLEVGVYLREGATEAGMGGVGGGAERCSTQPVVTKSDKGNRGSFAHSGG